LDPRQRVGDYVVVLREVGDEANRLADMVALAQDHTPWREHRWGGRKREGLRRQEFIGNSQRFTDGPVEPVVETVIQAVQFPPL